MYLDADIGNYAANGGNWLAAAHAGQMYAADASDSVRVGVVALPGQTPAAFRMIHNRTYLYPTDDIDDAVAWGFLTSGTFDAGVPSPADYSMVLACGPLSLAPGRTVHVAFAVAAGGSAATLQAAALAARAKYPQVVTSVIDPETPPQRFALGAPYPNPFNPALNVPVEVPPGGGPWRVEIYDLRGRRVRTLHASERETGRLLLVWNGRDDRGQVAASGVYFLRLRAASVEQLRKVVLVR
jgi:hypothetical protein